MRDLMIMEMIYQTIIQWKQQFYHSTFPLTMLML